MITVYFDTNVYIGAKYIFDKEKFSKIRELLSNNEIKLLYTSATENEVKRHIKDDIGFELRSYNTFVKKNLKRLYKNSDYPFKKVSNIQEIIDDFISKFDEFLNLNGVEKIPLNPINAESLMDDYFDRKPPFESKKPNEFKDAIMINAVNEYQNATKETIFIISSDKGFRNAFNNEEYIVFEYLGEFLKYCRELTQKDVSDIEDTISNYIETEYFLNTIKQYVEDVDIDRGFLSEFECEEKQINKIECGLTYINLENGHVYTSINTGIDITIVITYRDEDTSYYDKEDQCYYFENYITAKEKHWTDIPLNIEFEIQNNDGKFIITGFKIVTNDYSYFESLDLDDDTIYETKEIKSSMQEDDNNIEYCSECGKLIGPIHRVSFYSYYDLPLCNDCMIGDSEYDICPHCGKKIPREHMDNGYCDKCSSYIDD